MLSTSETALTSAAKGVYIELNELIELRALAGLAAQTKDWARSVADGSSASKRRGRGMEFAEVRPYQAGDDVRNIDWRVTARTQETHTKLFQEEKERPVFVAVDQRSGMFFGSRLQFKSVLAAKMAAYIAWRTLRSNDNLGGIVFNDQNQQDFRTKRGKRAVLRLLSSLASFNKALAPQKSNAAAPATAAPSNSVADIVDELRRIARPGSQIYLISDFYDFDQRCVKDLTMLSRHSDVTLIHVFDPLEASLPDNALLAISNGEARALLDTYDKELVEQYNLEWVDTRHKLKNVALESRSAFYSVSTADSMYQVIQHTFQSNKLRVGR